MGIKIDVRQLIFNFLGSHVTHTEFHTPKGKYVEIMQFDHKDHVQIQVAGGKIAQVPHNVHAIKEYVERTAHETLD